MKEDQLTLLNTYLYYLNNNIDFKLISIQTNNLDTWFNYKPNCIKVCDCPSNKILIDWIESISNNLHINNIVIKNNYYTNYFLPFFKKYIGNNNINYSSILPYINNITFFTIYYWIILNELESIKFSKF